MNGGAPGTPGRRAVPGGAGSVLPATPGLPGFAALGRGLEDLGFRHAAEPLLLAPRPGPVPPGAAGVVRAPTFRVLDGLWLSGRGGNWRRVDSPFVNECRRRWATSGDPRADAVRALLNRLRRRTRGDVMLLRRVVLYQLACMLVDGADGPTAEAAEDLGVDPAESAALASAVATGFPPAGPVREAGERIPDELRAGRLHRAAELAGLLPHPTGDPLLDATLTELRSRTTAVRALKRAADEREAEGRFGAAAEVWLGAARAVVDDPGARSGLLAVLARHADSAPFTARAGSLVLTPPAGPGARPGTSTRPRPGTAPAGTAPGLGGRAGSGPAPGGALLPSPLTVRFDEGAAEVEWPLVGVSRRRRSALRYVLLRFPDGAPEQAVEIASSDTAGTFRDTGVTIGARLRYAVLPLQGDRPAALPSVSAVVLSTPEVVDLAWKAVPDGVALGWTAHPEAVGTRVWRGSEPPVPGGVGGWLDRPLPAGDHWYRVSSGYRAPGGELVWSPGRTVSARAEEWPSPVGELTVDRVHLDGRIELEWTPPERGSGRLVPWHAWPATPGDDITALYAALPQLDEAPADTPRGAAAPGEATPDSPGVGEADGTVARAITSAPGPGARAGRRQDQGQVPPQTGPYRSTAGAGPEKAALPVGPDTGPPGGGDAVRPSVPAPATARFPGGAVRRRATLSPRPGTAVRVTAVSELEGRAVAGPSVLIEAPGPVTGLSAEWTAAGAARIRFDWPDPAVLVLIRWEQEGRSQERRVARSRMGPGGVELPLSAADAVVTVGALPRPDATVITTPPARLHVPAVPVPPPPPYAPTGPPPRLWQRVLGSLRRWWRPPGGHR
jgi:hypothetical protein